MRQALGESKRLYAGQMEEVTSRCDRCHPAAGEDAYSGTRHLPTNKEGFQTRAANKIKDLCLLGNNI
jgi:hypothetical protein